MTSRRSSDPSPTGPGRVALLDAPAPDTDRLAPAPARVVASAVARLEAEFPDRRATQILRTVHHCRRDLAGVPPGAVPELLERLARQRLRDAGA